MQREDDVKIQEEDSIFKPGREVSGETNPAETWISDL